ncbi:hypothetical protein FA13DRAFT_1729668 [Coprinellus micaceus]|uniref:RNI-like protein n=1 Tax=Coprinellus micaceus TaxID=71717 RepID=A0A4Y7TJ21_COPMI|nr:hypothetical protein FA13DRAFT_1729668 [Coprinellus micaceus]
MTTIRNPLATKVPLESRAQIHRLDAGLTSVRGAHEIISMISTRRTVTKLILGHNNLGNEGTNVLFRFLESSLGRKYPIAEISLNSNGIRNEGLLAISRYLKGNEELNELFLQANAFTGDPAVTKAFVEALNSSNLEILSLNTNHGLGDVFIEHFLPRLHAPRLRELHISTIGLTPRSVLHIAAFIRSPDRCRITTLKCNGNPLGLRGVKSIIRAIEQANYSLLSEGEGPEDETSVEAWKVCQARLARICVRNGYLRHETRSQALELLRYSRVLLLRSLLRVTDEPLPAPQPKDASDSWHGFAFTTLPTELQLSILSLLAPSLSSSQRSRVFGYAADASTLPSPGLPSLRPREGSSACLPDPSNPGAIPGLGGTSSIWEVNGLTKDAHCSGGRCIGVSNAASCNRDKERQRWLDAIGCSVYEPERS